MSKESFVDIEFTDDKYFHKLSKENEIKWMSDHFTSLLKNKGLEPTRVRDQSHVYRINQFVINDIEEYISRISSDIITRVRPNYYAFDEVILIDKEIYRKVVNYAKQDGEFDEMDKIYLILLYNKIDVTKEFIDNIRAINNIVGLHLIDVTSTDLSINTISKSLLALRIRGEFEHLNLEENGKLRYLSIHNKITWSALQIQGFPNLSSLEVIGECTDLDEIDGEKLPLRGIRLYGQYIPKWISHLPQLMYLKIEQSPSSFLDPKIFSYEILKRLILIHTQIIEIPEEIGKCSKLNELHLSFLPNLKALPQSIGCLTNLQNITIRASGLIELHSDVGKLVQLEELTISGTKISKIPDVFDQLKKIKMLSISGNQIVTLPDSIGNLQSLMKFYLERNQLKELPDTICNLNNLKELFANDNLLERIPEKIHQIEDLKLKIYNNNLKSLPELPPTSHNRIDISNNPLLEVIPRAWLENYYVIDIRGTNITYDKVRKFKRKNHVKPRTQEIEHGMIELPFLIIDDKTRSFAVRHVG